jgi:hypothetical protein
MPIMKKFVLAISLSLFSFTHVASAAVVLSEIAWMGSASSSADEWIELYNNTATSADLTGWKIAGKGGATIVSLSGTIAPQGYFLIERTDDDSVPDITADLVASFGKGIANDGETLKLIDGGGTVVDTVVGGKNWSKLGGDNASKETAQRTPSGWITAPATPRAPNKTPALATEVATPVKTQRSAHVVNVAHAVTHSNGNAWPTPPAVAPLSAEKVDRGTQGSTMNATSSFGANVLWQRGKSSDAETRAWGWMIVAALLVIVASVIIMRANIYKPTEADKYAIIEDIIEGVEEDQQMGDY